MFLARNKNGTIGRRVRAMGEESVIALPSAGSPMSNTQVSQNNVDTNQAYWAEREAKFRADLVAGQKKEMSLRAIKLEKFRALEKAALDEQALISINPIEDALKRKFAIEAQSPQSANVLKSIKADFFDHRMIPAPQEGIKSGVRSADFNINELTGNPLTRDGQYGVVTDYDRIVQGQPLAVGGRVNMTGETILRKQPKKRPLPAQMGLSWEDASNWFSSVGASTADNLANQLPAEIANQIKNQLLPSTTSPSGTVTYNVPVQAPPNYVQAAAQNMNVPPAVIYGALGLMGAGFLLVLVKSMK